MGQSPEQPLSTDKVEEVEVALVILDVVVLDKRGRPVPDLSVEDFELIVDGKLVPIDTLDTFCSALPTVDDAAQLAPKIVLALDYLHLDPIQRVDALEQIKALFRRDAAEGLQVMLVALTGGVRIEQEFTNDREELLAGLNRMQGDPSLSVPGFYHQNAFPFVDGLTALLAPR